MGVRGDNEQKHWEGQEWEDLGVRMGCLDPASACTLAVLIAWSAGVGWKGGKLLGILSFKGLEMFTSLKFSCTREPTS